ncbi:MAG: cytochrome c maturation protein CcmE [Melioribacteraceae bacterium]|nr:cytochrome c maturation protein CcmE [Melioribacteraceae bacterium]MCO6474207.1 cytochrome c maturation protein CcmE [Melioribacteraceae bacterium]MDD3557354.1 cytochrome c maturation protein CcmE [Melioribacteraceae bacterium]
MKNKYLIGGFIIVVFLGLMGYLFTQTNVAYENNFAEIKHTDKTIKATGAWVKSKGYDIDNEKNLFSFYMIDNQGVELKVVYKGAIPNNFESSTSVVVTGKYKNGYFIASDILTKCPSKYEEQYTEDTASNI